MTQAQAQINKLLRPLSARSLVASALLGTHPPALPGRLLVALGERFGISNGTTRVALSRMVDRGELTNRDGTYALAGALLDRQDRQDRSRLGAETSPWDGTWEQAIVTSVGRSSSERTRLRHSLATLGMSELREGVWMRPANLDPHRSPPSRAAADDQVTWYPVAPLDDEAAKDLVAQLFDLDGWAATANVLHGAITTATGAIDNRPDAHDSVDSHNGTRDDAVASGFTLASATLRHLVHDPQLPPELAPCGWPAQNLRQAYEEYERAYQQLLRRFFRTIGDHPDHLHQERKRNFV